MEYDTFEWGGFVGWVAAYLAVCGSHLITGPDNFGGMMFGGVLGAVCMFFLAKKKTKKDE